MTQKLLKLNDFSKVLVGYLYEKDTVVAKVDYNMFGPIAKLETVKGKKIGVVVALGDGILGWSLCNQKVHMARIENETGKVMLTLPADEFSKEIGLNKALTRANIASTLSLSEKESFYSRVPFSIKDLFLKMEERSERYFKFQESED